MATFKAVVLKHQVRNDATFNIKVRITHNRQSKYINTNWVVTKDDITRSFKLKNHFFIDETEKLIKQYRDICNKNALSLENMSVGQVIDLVTKTEKSDIFSLDIVEYGKKQIEIMLKNGKTEKHGTVKNLQSSLKSLIKFVGREEIDINEITAKFIKDWMEWMPGKQTKILYPANIRKLHNEAKREYNIEELGIVKIPLSPFSVVKLPKMQKRKKIDISVEKIRELFLLENATPFQKKADNKCFNVVRDLFLLSFCLWGTNARDLYECSDFKDGRITYNRTKTKTRRSDMAEISIKIEPEIMPLLEKYRDKTGERVFCFYQMYKSMEVFNSVIYRGVKLLRKVVGIDDLVFYSARHSFATIAVNDAEINEYTVHKMLNHIIEEMKITEIYVRKDWSVLDRANRKLLDFVLKK